MVELEAWVFNSDASTVVPSFVAEVAVPEASEVGFRIPQVSIGSHPIDRTKTSVIATVELALSYRQSTAEH